MEPEFRSAFWDDLDEALKDPAFRKEYEAQFMKLTRRIKKG